MQNSSHGTEKTNSFYLFRLLHRTDSVKSDSSRESLGSCLPRWQRSSGQIHTKEYVGQLKQAGTSFSVLHPKLLAPNDVTDPQTLPSISRFNSSFGRHASSAANGPT